MSISKTLSRPKLTTTTDTTITITDKAIATNGDVLTLRVVASGLPINTITIIGATLVSGNTTVTIPSGSIDQVRVGDAVTGTGIAANSKVTAVNKTNNTITLNNAATANGTQAITVDSPDTDGTLYAVELKHTLTGSSLKIEPTIYLYDGSKVSDKSGSGDDAAATSDAASNVSIPGLAIDLDGFLTKARVARVNG
jgi:hypothetical protein